MSQELNTALLVLVVGMLTVFLILFLVVLTGQVIIRIVNYYSNGYIPAAKEVSGYPPAQEKDKGKIAAIVAAVNVITEGKGKVERIESIEK